MNPETIVMDKQKAKEAFIAYREAVRRQYDKEYEALMHGYKHLAKGKVLLDLHQVIKNGGADSQHRPNLAIARADLKQVFMFRFENGSILYNCENTSWTSSTRNVKKRVLLPPDTFGRLTGGRIQAKAVVPLVPATHKPRGGLANFHILWEADWTNIPVDPILLKHLHGSLYAVLAQWDLTPLEQSVLRGRQ
jgi:hypothetical protein